MSTTAVKRRAKPSAANTSTGVRRPRTLRRLDTGTWILGGFLSFGYALAYRTIDTPTADLYDAPLQTPVTGTRGTLRT